VTGPAARSPGRTRRASVPGWVCRIRTVPAGCVLWETGTLYPYNAKALTGERLHVLQDDGVSRQGQPIALVIADTIERAQHAATLVRATYVPEQAITDIPRAEPVRPGHDQTDQGERRPSESRRGDPEATLAAAEVKVDQTYVIPRENHNPIEMHATIAAWEGDRLTLWDKTQWVHNAAHGVKLLRTLTDRGTEYCGNPERHEYELYLAVEDIDHSRAKTKSPLVFRQNTDANLP
jgi:hypothetical protein